MNYKVQSMKYVRRNVAFIMTSVCCLLLIASLQSCKNNDSSAKTNDSSIKAIESLDTSTDPCAVSRELAQKREKQAIEPLVKLIKRHEDKQVIKCAAEALASIDTDKSVDMLVNLLNDSDLMVASRSAFALGIIKDKRATNYLMKALLESNIPCPAAMALGMIKDPSAMAPLIKAMHHDNSGIRGCAIQGLALYGDPQVCETLTDVFMTDSDQGVQFMARAAKDAIKCPSGDKQPTKYSIADNYCRLGQRLIDIATPLLENTAGLQEWQTNEWQKSQNWKSAVADILPKYDKPVAQSPEGEKDIEMKFAIMELVTRWGENVVHYRLASDQLMRSTSESDIKDKMAKLYQLCPNLKFPDYTR
jgi:hypothetical protein